MAVYGLVSCLALLVLGNGLGRLVDVWARDTMVRAAILTQNITVSVTCSILALHFSVSSVTTTQQTISTNKYSPNLTTVS